MTTWIVGDVHGCAEELAQLVERVGLGPEDQLVSVGDLLHRGPDPHGVCRILEDAGARWVLGNHELAALRRCRLAPEAADVSDRPPAVERFPLLEASDLAGDGNTPCHARPDQLAEILRFLQTYDGFRLRSADLPHAGPTRDGRPWCVVHAGVAPGRTVEQSSVRAMTRIRRLEGRGNPWWYERWQGPDLVLFGHTHSTLPRVHAPAGAPLAIGLDTGCVYGGKLTAYSPELDEYAVVEAGRRWVAA